MEKFYCLVGETGESYRGSLESITKRAKIKASSKPGEEIIILQSYAVACTPINNVEVTVIN